MNNKYGVRFKLPAKCLAVAAVAAFSATASHAGLIYNEVGDAGDVVASAQSILGSGALDAIQGSLLTSSASDYADLFAIYLTSGLSFSATTTASSLSYNNFDTALFLFDGAGFGLLASDDDAGPQSTLSGFFPSYSGLYYLAIAGAGYDPISAGGSIFPSLISGGQYGPTGPGGALALSGWQSITSEGDAYEIVLDNASFVPVSVPEPSSGLLVGSALAAFLLSRRRRATSPQAQA